MKKLFRLIAITVVLAPASALANTWSCTHDDLIRTVAIEYSDGGTAPCSVNYSKESEGEEMKTLWSAQNQVTYCEEKAEGLVTKLESWGWGCTESEPTSEPESTPEAETESEPAAPATP